jgi:cell division protein FtsQ
MSGTPPEVAVGAVDEPAAAGADPPGGRNRTPLAVAGLILLVAALVTWIVAFSPVLGAKTVTVRGTRHLTAAQVRAVAAIRRGSPLVRLDTAAVARRVDSLPDVAAATVRTDYPSSVIITITERTAVGYLDSGGRYLLVDRTGAQYRFVASRPHALPRFAVASGADAKATGRAMATVAAALTPKLLARVTSIEAFDPTAITLLLTDQRVVRWGSADRSADKARILPVLLAQPGTRFDLTDPDQVVAR